jgi:hypothetical protein
MTILSGFGRPDFTTIGSGSIGKFLYVEPLEFNLAGNSSKVEAKAYRNGQMVRTGTKITEELYSLKLGIEAASWTAIQFAMGELASTTASIDLPEVRYGRVSSGGTYEILDPDIGAALGIWAFVTDEGGTYDEGSLELFVGAGSPAAGQFKVDAANDKLIFNAAQASAPIAYRLIKTYANLETIGVEQVATFLDKVSFSGIVYSDTRKYKIRIPSMSRASIPNLTLGSLTKLEVDYDLETVAGQKKPFQLFRMPANYGA